MGHFATGYDSAYMDLYEAMFKREGNGLPTSAFLSMPSGIFKPGTTKLEDKNMINELLYIVGFELFQ